jgi:Domain of unknown function (DUF1937)
MKLEFEVEDLLAHGPGYWYLSTPFTHFPGGHELAFQQACKIRGELLVCGISCYSPIAETYMVAKICGLPAADHDLWMADDLPKMAAARGLIVARMPNWQHSKGVAIEIGHFKTAGKPVVYLDP